MAAPFTLFCLQSNDKLHPSKIQYQEPPTPLDPTIFYINPLRETDSEGERLINLSADDYRFGRLINFPTTLSGGGSSDYRSRRVH